jgi:hypothetical protein
MFIHSKTCVTQLRRNESLTRGQARRHNPSLPGRRAALVSRPGRVAGCGPCWPGLRRSPLPWRRLVMGLRSWWRRLIAPWWQSPPPYGSAGGAYGLPPGTCARAAAGTSGGPTPGATASSSAAPPTRHASGRGCPMASACQLEAGAARVKGHPELPGDGRENCPLAATRSAQWRPPDGLGDQVLRGITPFPASAWDRRMLSPVVWHTCAWCMSRSTVAVARVLGMSSSNPDG